MVLAALEAAERLAEEDIEVEIIDLRTLSPLDLDTILESVAKTSRVIVLHEAQRTGGIGAEIAAAIAECGFEYLDAPPVRLASKDTPTPYSPVLEAAFRPSVEQIVATVRQLVGY
jgi:pyruvate/2-oxoglutarate/acetoin dehydrogenase E1 component